MLHVATKKLQTLIELMICLIQPKHVISFFILLTRLHKTIHIDIKGANILLCNYGDVPN